MSLQQPAGEGISIITLKMIPLDFPFIVPCICTVWSELLLIKESGSIICTAFGSLSEEASSSLCIASFKLLS